MVIVNIMPILVAFAILLRYNCSAHIMLPWVQQWRSDTFSSASKCQLSLPKNRQILLTGCWHTQHHTKTTSASLRFINLPKKHVCRNSNARFYPTMPVEQIVSVRFPNAKRGSILMEDVGLTLNNKGEVVRTSDSVPPSSSGTIVAAALLALADSSNKDLYLPAIHAPPGPRTNYFPGTKVIQSPRLPWSVRRQRRQSRRRPRGRMLLRLLARLTALQRSKKKGSPPLRRRPALRLPKLKLSTASLWT